MLLRACGGWNAADRRAVPIGEPLLLVPGGLSRGGGGVSPMVPFADDALDQRQLTRHLPAMCSCIQRGGKTVVEGWRGTLVTEVCGGRGDLVMEARREGCFGDEQNTT